MNARTKAIVSRFVLGFVLTEIPIVTAILAKPDADWRFVAIGLLGGLATALEKYLAPQIVSLNDPQAINGGPSIIGVALKDIKPPPANVDQIQQSLPNLATLDAAGVEKVEQ